jgi:exodeoxyribonuclease VII large subunit
VLPVLTVSEITRYIKQSFLADPILQNIYVKGEISNYSLHSSGHSYFTLKDKNSRIKCVMFKNRHRLLSFNPSNGMSIIAGGNISIYERDGCYQMYINELQPDGVGTLYLAYEQLKNMLENEGLFKQENKKKLPYMPKSIGIVTSPTGAAVRDIIKVIKRRMPIVNIYLYPVHVQGESAKHEISRGIKFLNSWGKVDVIIVGRGGGSIEELWAFNEEEVARAIFDSKIPVVSAVGHERDYTIADFVADQRAATPSVAGEICVPDLKEIRKRFSLLRDKMRNSILASMLRQKKHLENIVTRPVFSRPQDMIYQRRLLLDYTQKQLISIQNRVLENYKKHFTGIRGKVEALNPSAILSRGYSIAVKKETSEIIKSYEQVAIGDEVELLLHKGSLKLKVISKGRWESGIK